MSAQTERTPLRISIGKTLLWIVVAIGFILLLSWLALLANERRRREMAKLSVGLSDCQPGDVVFFAGRHMRSEVMQSLTMFPASHVCIVVERTAGRCHILEVDGQQPVTVCDLGQYLRAYPNTECYVLRMRAEKRAVLSDGGRSPALGLKYKHYLRRPFADAYLRSWFTGHHTQSAERNRAVICSELVLRVLRDSFGLFQGACLLQSPATVYRWCSKLREWYEPGAVLVRVARSPPTKLRWSQWLETPPYIHMGLTPAAPRGDC